jgi:hypothetical protein
MINEEEKFNDLLRSKLNEREFFFDELNWDKAEQAIVKEETRKKRKRFLLIFLGGFILGAAIMFPLSSMLTSGNKQNSSTTHSAPVAINDDKTSTSANNIITTPAASTVNSSQGPTTTSPSEPTSNNATALIADKAKSGDKKAAKHKKAKSADNPDTYAYVRPASERKHKKPVENPYIDELPDNLKPKNATTQSSDNNNQNQQSLNNSTTKNKADKNTSVTDNNKGSVNSSGQQNLSTNNYSSQNNNTPVSANAKASKDSSNGLQTNKSPVQAQSKTDSNKLSVLAPVNSPTQNKNFVTRDDKTADVPKPVFKPTNSISIDAGAGYSLGWKNENSKGGNGISPLIGVRLNHSFSKKISLGVGVRYYGLTNLNSPYSSTDVSYNFGVNSSVVTVSPQMLHYLAIPVELQYHFGLSNTICLGGNLLYLVNTSSTVTTYTQNGLETPSSQKKTAWGYIDGFNQFDAQMVIAYRRRLFGAFSASAEAYYGLMDVENNSFFLSSTFERNSGLRLVLSYDIIK